MTTLFVLFVTLATVPAGAAETARVIARSANVRHGPSLQASIVGTIEQGLLVEVIAWPEPRPTTWASIALPGMALKGWIYGALLEIVPNGTQEPTVARDKATENSSQEQPSREGIEVSQGSPPEETKPERAVEGSRPMAKPAPTLAQQLRSARHRKRVGKWLVAGGAVLLLVGTARRPSVVDRLECLTCEPKSNSGLQLAGLGTAGVGTYLWITGAKEASRIERLPVEPPDQRAAFLPTPRDMAAALTIRGLPRRTR